MTHEYREDDTLNLPPSPIPETSHLSMKVNLHFFSILEIEFSFCVIFIKKLICNSAGYSHVPRNNIRYGNYLLYHKDKITH